MQVNYNGAKSLQSKGTVVVSQKQAGSGNSQIFCSLTWNTSSLFALELCHTLQPLKWQNQLCFPLEAARPLQAQ